MKNKILIFLIFATIIGCSGNKIDNQKWKEISLIKVKEIYKDSIDWSLVKTGDILVQETDGTFLGWFGHCGLVVSEKAVAEIPKLGEKVYYRDIDDWKQMRRVAVLRYKDIDSDLRKTIFKNAKKSIGRSYGFTSKKGSNVYYCSQYIWNIYYISGKESKREIDIDSNGGFLVMPYEFLKSDELEIVDMMK